MRPTPFRHGARRRDTDKDCWRKDADPDQIGAVRATGFTHIAQQETHHRVVSFQEEFRKLLHAHGIAYDDRYVWD